MGNRTKIDFYDVMTNTGISDELFDFVPPENVEVLEAEELSR